MGKSESHPEFTKLSEDDPLAVALPVFLLGEPRPMTDIESRAHQITVAMTGLIPSLKEVFGPADSLSYPNSDN